MEQKKMKKSITIALLLGFTTSASASELVWKFNNPSFNGIGYSAHILSLEQLKFNRKEDLEQKARAEATRIESGLKSSTLDAFLKNVESRIYATLSKQMVDAMFADCADSCSNSGFAEIEGNTIAWTRNPDGSITLDVSSDDGSYTTITLPGSGEFNFQ